jgi:hypothetical protein
VLPIKTSFLIDEAIAVSLEDRISVPTKRTLTDAGQMHVPCAFARTGSQLYTAKQLGLVDREPNEVIKVYRDEADVFAEDSMATFKSAPLTIGHPKDSNGAPMPVTAENAKELQVGMLEGMPTRDEDTLTGTLIITNKEAIDALEDGTQELSAGYLCDIEDVDGKFYQRNIRANHIAIVDKGRAGSSCRISDEVLEVQLGDGHPQPMQWEFENEEAYKVAFKSWIAVEYNEYFGSADAEGKAAGNTGVVDEALLTDAQESLVEAEAKISAQEVLLADAERVELELEQTKILLADAKVAAEEGVIERCDAIENARLIADMRDLGSKSVQEIYRMVVEDQMPHKNLEGKSDAFVAAMFELLVDASKGETPMGKLLKQESLTNDTKVVSKTNIVEDARTKMIARQSGK